MSIKDGRGDGDGDGDGGDGDGVGDPEPQASAAGDDAKPDDAERRARANRKKKERAKLAKLAKRGQLPAKGRLAETGGGGAGDGDDPTEPGRAGGPEHRPGAAPGEKKRASGKAPRTTKAARQQRAGKREEKWPGAEALLQRRDANHADPMTGAGVEAGRDGISGKGGAVGQGAGCEEAEQGVKEAGNGVKRRASSGAMVPASVQRRRLAPDAASARASEKERAPQEQTPEQERKGESGEQGVAASAATGASSDSEEDGPAQPPPRKATTARQGRPSFIYGNYSRYYGYRFHCAFDRDPRLAEMEASWFAGRRLLDIGCHEGVITLAMVAQFRPSITLGVDIDPKLVGRAEKNRGFAIKAAKERLLSRPDWEGDTPSDGRAAAAELSALQSARFRQGSVQELEVGAGSADAITLLSVCKWIHLHAGDRGLKAVFKKLAAALAPGGVLVVEPQPWKSYNQAFRKQVMPTTCFKPEDLRFTPDKFPKYLRKHCRLTLLKHIEPGKASEGFQRSIYVFRKPAGDEAGEE
eukprot:jgi/Tetstr1/427636/TSEL_017761.t1